MMKFTRNNPSVQTRRTYLDNILHRSFTPKPFLIASCHQPLPLALTFLTHLDGSFARNESHQRVHLVAIGEVRVVFDVVGIVIC